MCNVTAVGGNQETGLSVVRFLSSQGARAPASRRTVVQTNCPITSGDSGGPLFNEAGEVVGLNDYFSQERRDGSAYGSPTYFHVELRHLKELADAPPAAPMRRVPNAWQGAESAVLSDLDGDGSPETLGLWKGAHLVALLFDGLQRTALSGVEAAQRKKAYPAHVTLYAGEGDLMMQVGETLLVLDGASVKAAYAVKQGNATPLPKDAWPASWSAAIPALAPEAAARLKRLIAWTVPTLASAGEAVVPALEADAKASAAGDDETLTILAFKTASGVALVMDPDSQRPDEGRLSPETLAAFKPRLGLVVNQLGGTSQVLFDTDADGKWDRSVLLGPDGNAPLSILRSDVKERAGWVTGPLIHQLDPRWATTTPAGVARVTKLLTRVLARELVAGLPRWPAVSELEGDLELGLRNKGKGKEALLTISGGAVEAMLIAGPVQGNDPAAVQQQLGRGLIKPAFAFMTSVEGQWALYDWNVDGKVDLALLSDDAGGITEAWALQKDGACQPAEEETKGALLRWKAFKSPELRNFAREALNEVFDPGSIER